MQPRTKRQREVLDFIAEYTERKGYSPSYQLIARELHINSKSAVAKHVAALESQGLLRRRNAETGSFTMQISSPAELVGEAVCVIEWLELPFPDAAAEEFEKTPLPVPRFMLGYADPEKIHAFRVRSDAMIEDHICEGDIALVEKRSFARDGARVIAEVEGRIVLKKFYRTGSEVELIASNAEIAPLRLAADKVRVLAVFRGLLRPLV